MKKNVLWAPLLCLFFVFQLQAQTTRTAGTYAELTNAITLSADNDIIKITNNIVVSNAVSNSKTITINGNGYSITVPVTGLDASGKFNATPSGFRVFTLTGTGKTTTINNLTISGGYSTTLTGAAISVGSGHTLKINHSTISNSRGGTNGGGGLENNGGTVYMYNCEIMRNAAEYGGGFLNQSSGKMFVEKCTFSENRSTGAAGGGGAGENKTSSLLYINNSTLSNNKSTEIGGGINNSATIYILNSSLTGNVAYGGYKGGAIGNNNGTVYAVNSLFAYNYRRATGTTGNPTTYVLDDVEANGSPGNVHLRYCIYHAGLGSSGVDYSTGHNINYTGLANGSNNSIFSGGVYTRITDGTGIEIGDVTTGKVYQPFLYDNAGDITPTLKTGSFILQSGSLGAKTGFTNGSGTPVIGYYDRLAGSPAWVNLVGSPASSYVVTSDQIGTTRTDPPSVGAIQSIVENLYMLKINYSADGSVDGGALYGNVYPSGTSVELVALPNAGKRFVRWDYVVGGTGTASTNNPYTVLVDRDITLVPIFQDQPANTYGLTYVGNGITSGTVPASGNFTGSSTIASVGTMKRSGYIFNGWNTRANGTGTAYSGGATYTPSPAANLILYAQWTDNFWRGTTSTDFATSGNWGSGTVPATGADIVFAEDASRNLVLDMNRQVGNVQFSGANYKLELGNYNLTATGVTNNSSTRYIQTSGTGTLCISVANNATT
ncbi:MAG TPA: InlB B-repeat-containing protein, partial [Agriterribacter sp.]|nr:InlB B-repeat-containing protein [Agriterribacter sp.]